uniref:Mu-like prophage protein gp36 n=1 Tax=Candidatus Kentrum sp. TC TaxID=2126339 RepID=A0A450YW89_9GAMM|nr:MAG: Mu-like prophage protein gp36 [Candidatus Kentron sp. TC]
MAYCDQADLEKAVTTEILVQLTRDDIEYPEADADPAPDGGIVSWAIDRAGDLMDGYFRGRYPLPFASPPPMTRHIAVDLARYFLYQRRAEGESGMPEIVRDAYRSAMARLREIQGGTLSLGEPETRAPLPDAPIMTASRGVGRLFDRESLRGYLIT